ncbi:hypothetical protein [Spiroplasma chrysopicola]|uniref:Lipoprotein n=1 Tax=Spiroplasma chrysopicola DF-1 TaxID=1276227 RepID=R4U4N6_9MOLU|nr:hypothetical protein [Spiroplasma chrysopicola]AGM25528.1 hypothetical protein SCHRY_v1c09560 [Spiroplasma chrysopicola DF-1]
MKKLLLLMLSTTITVSPSLLLVACQTKKTVNDQVPIPQWLGNLKTSVTNGIGVGYNGYLLPSVTNPYQQTNWVDLEDNHYLYLYLEQATTLSEAAKYLKFSDSANLELTTHILEPIILQENENYYGSESFLTQNTWVNGRSVFPNQKWADIKNSKNMKQLNDKFQAEFKNHGTISDGHPIQPGSDGEQFVWWNSNKWDKLLTTKTQQDIYGVWSNTSNPLTVGMNVPLSLITEDSIKLQITPEEHVFALTLNFKEHWIDNNFNIVEYDSPHWGYYFSILDAKGEKAYTSSQLIPYRSKTFASTEFNQYLQERDFYSFNAKGYQNSTSLK